MRHKSLLDDVLTLSPQERLRLLEAVWDSLSADPSAIELTDAQRQELDERLRRHEENPRQGVSWDEVKHHIRNRH
jgi:putative addiction module component (TIGR02574 family)